MTKKAIEVLEEKIEKLESTVGELEDHNNSLLGEVDDLQAELDEVHRRTADAELAVERFKWVQTYIDNGNLIEARATAERAVMELGE